MAGVWGLAWLGQREGRGQRNAQKRWGAEDQHGPVPNFASDGLSWREEALALPRHRTRALSGLQSESFSPGCF